MCVCMSVRRQFIVTRLIVKLVMKLVLLLALLSVSECSSSRVVGLEGRSVTLACKYNIKYYNALPACWGRGHLPASGCGNPLISTQGLQVVDGSRVSSRYQLLGRLDEGDVSLTILNVTHSDAGSYGCRVEIPGLFNDVKQHIDLVIETAAQTTAAAATLSRPTSAPSPADTSAAGQVTSAVTLLASLSSSIEAEEEEDSVETLVLVCVLFGLVAVATAGGLVIIARRWRRLNKIPQQQQVNPSVHFSSTSSTLHLHSRGSAVENIYEIDDGGEGGEYERCP